MPFGSQFARFFEPFKITKFQELKANRNNQIGKSSRYLQIKSKHV